MSIKNLINKYKILYVEDDQEVMNHLLKMFHEIFYSIDVAQNGQSRKKKRWDDLFYHVRH